MSEKLLGDFEESQEPSVLSQDPNERKLARRLRIQKRTEALKKLVGDEEESALEESLTEKQIVASAELLEKLLAEGNEVITNVRVANDARELERRKSATEVRVKLLKHLEESARECKHRYEIINERWTRILQCNDPLDISSEMEMQKEKCDEILAKKDAVIQQLKLELQKADDKYFDDQNKQKSDTSCLIERIENQMGATENVYGRELELIEKTLKTERDALVGGFQKKWDALYHQQEDEDAGGDAKRIEIMREYEEEMDRVMTDHDEEYRARKIELESECQALQQQVEKTKTRCLLNAEKLSYNYNVLKSREEENSIVKSQQKRKINRLQTIINGLQKNCLDLKESTELQIGKLSNQIVKTHKSITELEEKSLHFTRVNEKQYLDIWQMNDDSASELVKKIFTADKMIHERILGILWEPPQKDLPKKDDLPSYRIAVDSVRHQKQDIEKSRGCINRKLKMSISEARLEKQVLNNILKQISNSSGYLVENKLQDLISHRSEDEKTIIKLDNVFQALSISSPEEIDLLLDFFLPYSHCPTCSAFEHASSESFHQESTTNFRETVDCSTICKGCNNDKLKELILCVEKDVGRNLRKKPSEKDDSLECNHEKCEERENIFDRENVTRFQCHNGHVLEIQTASVTKALKEMVTKCNGDQEKQMLSFEGRLKDSKYTISRNLTVTDVKKYWSSYRDVFSKQKEQLWDAVLIGLNKYYEVLKERHNVCNEKDNLKKQNIELQRLLESHTTSPEENFSILQVHSTKHLA